MWDQARIQLGTPGSAVIFTSVARHVTDCAMRPGIMGTSLKRKTSLPEGANSFLYEQFIIVWKITSITLSDLPRMLLFLLRLCLTCVMGAMLM